MTLHVRRNLRVTDYLNPNDGVTSFAIIGGDRDTRYYLGRYALARSLGHVGIILLHNDPSFEQALVQALHFSPDIDTRNPDFRAIYANGGYGSRQDTYLYSPLFGLDEASALKALLPAVNGGAYAQPHGRVHNTLRCYWRMLEALGVDASLDSLLWIVEIPVERVQQDIFPRIPQDLRAQAQAELAQVNAQQDALAAVLAFSYNLDGALWARRHDHTGISIADAIPRGHLISLQVQPQQGKVLEYLDIELQALSMRRVPFLLVACSLALQGTLLSRWFFSEHPYYTTGIIANGLTNLLESTDSDASVLQQSHPDTIVLQCPDFYTAEAFSLACGTFKTRNRVENRNVQRHRFSIRTMVNRGWGEQIHEERSIRPEELQRLGSGALLMNLDKGGPYIARKLILPS